MGIRNETRPSLTLLLHQSLGIRTTIVKLRAQPAKIWSAVTCHRFCRFWRLVAKAGPRSAAPASWTPSRIRRRQVACRKRGQVHALQSDCDFAVLGYSCPFVVEHSGPLSRGRRQAPMLIWWEKVKD